MYRHVLVPTDGSELSEKAVDYAILSAKERKRKITFYFARPDADASLYGELALLRTMDPELLAKVERRGEEILARAQAKAKAAGIECDTLATTAAEPYEGIIAAAQDRKCDLIIMASNGHRGVKGLWLGSQTQKVLLHSKYPVLVFR
jgi:nucleotide-binding universal stress UspA family protein